MHLANTRTRTEWGPRWRHINTARLSFNATLPRRGQLMVQARRGLIAHGGLLRQQSLAAMHRLRPAIHPAPGQGLRGRLRREGGQGICAAIRRADPGGGVAKTALRCPRGVKAYDSAGEPLGYFADEHTAARIVYASAVST